MQTDRHLGDLVSLVNQRLSSISRWIEPATEFSYDLLSEREKEVLQLIAEGKTNKDVAGPASG
ncbi:MAG: hypothetical protein DMG17_29060 [Acidobacteria bacterium]|nr:MAG: hypothetical protein DMG17_29060 [Acidobacteriota bacterium]